MTVRLWDVRSRKPVSRAEPMAASDTAYTLPRGEPTPRRPLSALAFSQDGLTLASGDDRAVTLWDVATGSKRLVFEALQARIWALAFSPDGTKLAFGGEDPAVRLFNLTENRAALSPAGVGVPPPSRRQTMGGTSASLAEAFGEGGGPNAMNRNFMILRGHRGAVQSLAFSPNGTTLASGSEDLTVKLWDVGSGKELANLTGHNDSIRSIAFSPDGKTLASKTEDRLRLWNAATGREITTLKSGWDATQLVFSPNGAILAEGTSNRMTYLWDVSSRTRCAALQGNITVLSLAFSPDGARLATGTLDVQVWDVATGQELITLKGHAAAVRAVVFSPDGRTLTSASQDGTLRVWRAAKDDELPEALKPKR